MLRRRAPWRSGRPARVHSLGSDLISNPRECLLRVPCGVWVGACEGTYWDLIREDGTLNLCAPYAGTMVMRSEIFSIAAHRKTYSIYIRATGKIQ